MARSTTILPVGWQVAARRASETSDSHVYYLQREQSGKWVDVAGPYVQRSGAINAYGRYLAEQAGAITTRSGDGG